MTGEKTSELRQLLNQLRSDIYAELDTRITSIESQLDSIAEDIGKGGTGEVENLTEDIASIVSDDIEEYIAGEVTEKIGERIDEHFAEQEELSKKKLKEELKKIKAYIQLKTLFWGVAVVLGGWLTWYGAWGIIGTVPFLQNPSVALLVGIALLVSTGAVHRKLIG